MNNNYEIIKNLEKIRNGYPTRFLDSKIQNDVKSKLKKNEYFVYYPYLDSEKVIFYKDIKPQVALLEIISKDKLEHRDILGSVFSLGIDQSMFGDIIITENHYYIYVLDEIKKYFLNHFHSIKKTNITLEERDINLLKDFKRSYLGQDLIVSSERIDTIISHLIGVNRNKIKDLMKNKDILLNYNILTNNSYKLHENDIFSIRKYGKYKYVGVIKQTKNGNLVIRVNKYI